MKFWAGARGLPGLPGRGEEGSREAELAVAAALVRGEPHAPSEMLGDHDGKGVLLWVSPQPCSSRADGMAWYWWAPVTSPLRQIGANCLLFSRSSGRVRFLKKSHRNGVCSVFAQKHTSVPVPQVRQHWIPHPRLVGKRNSVQPSSLKEPWTCWLAQWEWTPYPTGAGDFVPFHGWRAQFAYIYSLLL